MVSEKSFVVKLNKNCGPCQGCKNKVPTAVKKAGGVVYSCNFDADEVKLTVSGTVDRKALLDALRKDFKKAELLSKKKCDTKNAGLLSKKELDTKSSLKIVAAKPVQGVLHPNPPDDQLHQLSHNTQKVGIQCVNTPRVGTLEVSNKRRVIKSSLQIVAAKPVGVLHHNPPVDQLQQLSHNTHQGKASDDASLGVSTTKGNKIGQSISHEHDRLELKNYNKPFICSGCKELGFGPRFRCKSSSCDYELHKECKKCCNKSKRKISHKFFQGYTFEFFDKLSKKVCDACGKDICGFGYHSEAKGKSLDLHPCCSKLQSKICIDGDDFELHDKVLSKCKWCDKKDLHGDKTRISGWSYISARNKCHFHVYCVSEMLHEAWKQGLIDNIDSSISMALAKMDPQILPAKRKKGKRNSGHHFSLRIMKMFLKAIAAVLLGDPTMFVVPALVELFT